MVISQIVVTIIKRRKNDARNMIMLSSVDMKKYEKNKIKPILLTGATGFVGRAVKRELDSSGYSVISAVRQSITSIKEVAIENIDGMTNWSHALAHCDAVIHLAARAHIMNDDASDPLAAYRSTNTHGTINLANQAAAAGVKRFIFVSSVKVNGEQTLSGHRFTEDDVPAPQDAYGFSKHEAELGLKKLAEDVDMEVVIIRPPLVYGPGVKANFAALMAAVQSGWPLPLGNLHNQRSLVALDNLVDFILTCLHHPAAANQTFIVSDGRDLSTTELVRGIALAAGVSSRLWPAPRWALQLAANALGRGKPMHRLCGDLQLDIGKAGCLLCWVPPISVEEGLRRIIEVTPTAPTLQD